MEQLLPTAIFYLLAILVLLWLVMAYSILYRQFQTKKQLLVKNSLIDIIVSNHVLSNEDASVSKQEDQRLLVKYIRQDRGLWHVASIFAGIRDTFTASSKDVVYFLVQNLGLQHIVSKKISKVNWYSKAKSIHLIYELNLPENIDKIIPLTNHKNILVRREAQIAVVVFLGWKSLKVLPKVNYPISLWQQIRIVEKLFDFHPIPETQYLDNALGTDNPFVKELLIRLIRRFELVNYKYYIIQQLFSENRFVVECAVDVLYSFELTTSELQEINEGITKISIAFHQTLMKQLVAKQTVLLSLNN